MLQIIGKIWKNKVFMILMILIIITLPSTIYKQSDKDKTIVTSSIGIDLKEDMYEVTILAVIPKGENDVNANLETFSAEGKSVSDALDQISFDIGRKIGLAHCDCIIFNEELMSTNLTKILDYFVRTANLSTNPSLIGTQDSAKDLLSAVKSSNNLFDLSLKNIITSQEDRTLLDKITIDRFYRAYYSPNSTFTIPMLSIQSDSESSSSQGGGNSGGNTSDSGAGSSNASSGQSEEQKKIKNSNDIAILRDGKFLNNLSEDEKFIYSLVTKPSHYQKFVLEEINDENFTATHLVFQEADKIIVPIPKFEDGKPVMEYNIWLSVMIDEAMSEYNHNYGSITGTQNYLTDTVKEEFHKLVNKKLESTINAMQENKYDVLNLYAKFNAYKHRKFEEYIEEIGDVRNYMKDMSIKINLKLNYVI